MKKFLVLYQSTVSASEQMKNATPQQAKAGMDAWMAWARRAGSGIVDMGSPVASAGRVSASPAAPAIHRNLGCIAGRGARLRNVDFDGSRRLLPRQRRDEEERAND